MMQPAILEHTGVAGLLDDIRRREVVERIYLFGARARGDNRRRSDIDLAGLAPKASRSEWNRLQSLVEQAGKQCVRFADEEDVL